VLRQGRRSAEIAASLPAAIAPYTTQLAHDRELRQRLAGAIRSSVITVKRVRRHTGTSGLIWALATDPVLKRHIAEAVADVQDAKRRIDRSRHRRMRVIAGLLGLSVTAALIVPVVRRATNGSETDDAVGTT
jgi:hypothetical protein